MTENFRDQWIAVMKQATTGHLPEPERAVDASIAEARECFEAGLFCGGSKVLDVGSGNGRTAVGLLRYGLAEYVGIEPMRACVEFSRAAFAGHPEYEFLWVDVRTPENPGGTIDPMEFTIPFRDGYFDAVVAGSLFTHLSRREVCERYLSEVYRVLREDGRFLSSWFVDPPNEITDSFVRTVFPSQTVVDMLDGRFSISHTRGGTSTQHDDQWCVFSKKILAVAEEQMVE
jgi:SAM-dependent methyltransferase